MQATLALLALTLAAPALKDKEKEILGKGPGYMGIYFHKEEGGLIISEVRPDGPAEKSGMKVDDLVVKLDDKDLSNAETDDFIKAIAAKRPGQTVNVHVRRGAETLVIKVKLGARPPDFPTPPTVIDD